MTSYDITNRPTKLREGDEVLFTVGSETVSYEVENTFLNNPAGSNERIFRMLDIGKKQFVREHYGYDSSEGDWPCFKCEDYDAATRVVNALFERIGGKETAMPKPKTKVCQTPLGRVMFDATQRMARHMKTIKPVKETPIDAKSVEMAKIIIASDFGCQRENVAKLMAVATGLPVLDAYKREKDSKAPDTITKAMRFKGAVMVLTQDEGDMKAGDIGLVWTDKARTLRIGAKDADVWESVYSVKKLRPATEKEIAEYIKADANWLRSKASDWAEIKAKPVDEALEAIKTEPKKPEPKKAAKK